ncbi:MAG: type II toxin-antitoxin system Phd/YefM family antitoxin [Betaproteobacteria bacterium]|nr:type II toxin-antitoxin system Phd/YefM family antitoxin [Betaproteobacteria bacterium]
MAARVFRFDGSGAILKSDYLIHTIMRDKTISATEAARGFSEVLNQVQYRDVSFAIERGNKVVARLVPPAVPVGMPIAELKELLASLPHLSDSEAKTWRAEIKAQRRAAKPQARNWA